MARLAVGSVVSEAGRIGTVVALRPQGMVDVRFGQEPVQRRPAQGLQAARSNPGTVLPYRQNHHLAVGQRVARKEWAAMTGTVQATHVPDQYTVTWDQGGQNVVSGSLLVKVQANPPRANPAKGDIMDPHREQLRRVMMGVRESLVQRGAPDNATTTSKAWAIATRQLQKHGYLVPGTQQATLKGIQRSRAKLQAPHAEVRRQAYEATLANERVAKGHRVVKHGDHAFTVEPGGKMFFTEKNAMAYAAKLGTVTKRVAKKARSTSRAATAKPRKSAKKKATRKVANPRPFVGTQMYFDAPRKRYLLLLDVKKMKKGKSLPGWQPERGLSSPAMGMLTYSTPDASLAHETAQKLGIYSIKGAPSRSYAGVESGEDRLRTDSANQRAAAAKQEDRWTKVKANRGRPRANPRARRVTYRGMLIRSCGGAWVVEAFGEPFRELDQAKKFIDTTVGKSRGGSSALSLLQNPKAKRKRHSTKVRDPERYTKGKGVRGMLKTWDKIGKVRSQVRAGKRRAK
ncbi:MAG: hypothetical protein Q8Q85_00085 [Gemmatimonadales bacterium]|nr:hypothetical protein [Gemmatimonadales bacterium]